jgi:autotransporter translocation and assembly factor TamB
VHVGGTLNDPVLELSSQPPLDDGEILSLIVFNQSLNALGAAQQVSLAQQALGLAAGFVTDRIVESLAGELELDILELRLAEGGTPALTIGEQLGEDVYVKVRQQLGALAARSLLLEYELADWVRLVARFAEQQGTTENLFNRIDRGRISLDFTVRY